MPPESVALPVQLALDSSAAVGAVHAPMALNARFSVIPVCCSQLTTYATSAALICTSAGMPGPDPAATPWSAVGQVKSGGLVAAGVHWNVELHSLSAMKLSSMSWPK